MDNVSRRLNTFSNWPLRKQVWPLHLANAGFVYTGDGTRVQCVYCRVETSVDQWSMGEKPEVVHFRVNPSCEYLRENGPKDEIEERTLCQATETTAINGNQSEINILHTNNRLFNRVNETEIYEDSDEIRSPNTTVQPSCNDDEEITKFNTCPVHYNSILSESGVNELQLDSNCKHSYSKQNVFLNKKTQTNLITEAIQFCEQCSLYQRLQSSDDRTHSIVLPSSYSFDSIQKIPNGLHENVQLPSNYSNGFSKKQETLQQWIPNAVHYETRMPRTYNSLSNNLSSLDSGGTLFDVTNTLITQQPTPLAESAELVRRAANNLQRNIASEKTNINTTNSCPSVDVDQDSASLAHKSTLQHDEPQFMFPNFRHFQERFISYRNWLSSTKQSPHLLAESGYFYTGEKDVVRCFCCNLGLSEWSANDNPWIEHARHNPKCWFLLNQKGQEFIDSIQSDWIKLYKPKNPAFDDMTSRLATFDGWRDDIEQTPHILADAGFFYTGETDVVRCHYCDGGLKNWEPGDIPWEEHARWFSTCKYLIKMKGFRYIKNVQKKYESQLAPINTAAGLAEPSDKNEELLSSHAARSELRMEIPYNPVITAINSLTDPAKLKVINNELKNNLLCVICKKNEKCMLFTNCGHRVTCDQCCHSLECCPHCKKKIKKVIKTFLS